MLDRMNHYINDLEFRFTIFENKIHIMNFTRIISLEENRITFQTKNQKYTIKGSLFVLKKILEKELLIEGIISTIEVQNEKSN